MCLKANRRDYTTFVNGILFFSLQTSWALIITTPRPEKKYIDWLNTNVIPVSPLNSVRGTRNRLRSASFPKTFRHSLYRLINSCTSPPFLSVVTQHFFNTHAAKNFIKFAQNCFGVAGASGVPSWHAVTAVITQCNEPPHLSVNAMRHNLCSWLRKAFPARVKCSTC